MANTKPPRPITGLKNEASLIFRTPWGWMGVAESEQGLAAIVLPQRSKAAVAASLGVHKASRRASSSPGSS